jgi:hypothetical protein
MVGSFLFSLGALISRGVASIPGCCSAQLSKGFGFSR